MVDGHTNSEQQETRNQPRKILICLDGTWNNPESRTNVYRMFQDAGGVDARHLSRDSVKNEAQIKYYDEGVGSRFARIWSGMTGAGLVRNIYQAYEFLCYHYQEGDRVFIVGFSRGAYTARSLTGLIESVGLLPIMPLDNKLSATSCDTKTKEFENQNQPRGKTSRLEKSRLKAAIHNYKRINIERNKQSFVERHLKEANRVIRPAIKVIRPITKIVKDKIQSHLPRGESNTDSQAKEFAVKKREYSELWGCDTKVRVHFLGVWDTVGSLGIPRLIPDFWIFNKDYHAMHDTSMCRIVDYAYHAMAIDEHRKDFEHTPWTNQHPDNREVCQCWFSGAHANIGGGENDNKLSNIAGHWIQEKAQALGLLMHYTLDCDYDDDWETEPVTDSYKKFISGLYRLVRRRHHREIILPTSGKPGSQSIHSSVWNYLQRNPGYRPENLPLHARPEAPHDG